MSRTLHPLLAIVIAAIVVLCMTGLGMVTGVIPEVTRQAVIAPDSQDGAAAPSQARPAGPLWTTASSPCNRCGTVMIVYSIEQESEGFAPGTAFDRLAKPLTSPPAGMRRWDVVVAMDDGSSRTFSSTSEPSFRPGDRVMVVGRTIMV